METVRTWARWTSTALGASLLVPVAIVVVAAGVAVGGGGLGGINALGQLIDGPRDPLAEVEALAAVEADLAREQAETIARLRVAPRPAPDARERPGGNRDAGGRGEQPRRGAPGGEAPPRERGEGPRRDEADRDRGGGRDDASPPASPGGGDAGTEPSPAPRPGPLAPLRDGAGSLVDQLPEPVRPVTGEIVNRVVDLGERVLGSPGLEGLLGTLDSRP